ADGRPRPDPHAPSGPRPTPSPAPPRAPRTAASRLLVEQEHPRAGRFRTLDTPIRFDRTPGGIRTPAPGLGEHTDAVLTEAGLRPADLADLRKSGAIR